MREDKTTIISKVSEYIHWLTIPKSEFGNMAPCPFLDKELRDDKLYIDIWYPSECTFMDLMESFLLSNKNSALIVCPNTHTIDYSQVSRSDIQQKITQLLRDNPQTEYLKSLCFSPYEDFKIAGISTRSGAPYFMINIAPTAQLGKAHKDLKKTSYYDNFTNQDKRKMKVQ